MAQQLPRGQGLEAIVSQALHSFALIPNVKKATWYSPAAQAYVDGRPGYESLMDEVCELAGLTQHSKILEVGCGPGTATVSIAPRVGEMLCVDLNVDFVEIAKEKTREYKNVSFEILPFEEFDGKEQKFDAIIAASSIHWVPSDVAYPKIRSLLKADGHLILLYNHLLQPSAHDIQALSPIYQKYAPDLDAKEWKSPEQHSNDFVSNFGDTLEAQNFQIVKYNFTVMNVVYTAHQFTQGLHSYSHYLKLEEDVRNALFVALRHYIDEVLGGSIALTYVSAYHVAK